MSNSIDVPMNVQIIACSLGASASIATAIRVDYMCGSSFPVKVLFLKYGRQKL